MIQLWHRWRTTRWALRVDLARGRLAAFHSAWSSGCPTRHEHLRREVEIALAYLFYHAERAKIRVTEHENLSARLRALPSATAKETR